MPPGSRITDAPISDFFGEQLGIPAENATKTVFALRHGFSEILFHVDAAARLHLTPAITEIFHFDASASAGSRWVSLLGSQGNEFNSLINRSVTGGTGTQLDSLAVADFIYIGTTRRHGGIDLQMTASVNGTNSVLTAAYGADTSFTADAITDGTISGSATMAQDGNITIDSVPTQSLWRRRTLSALGLTDDGDLPAAKLYWWRLDVSVELDSDTEWEEVICFHHTNAADVAEAGGSMYVKSGVEYTIDIDRNLVGGLEFSEDAAVGSKLVNLTWISRGGDT